jgi:hypothetical protein
MSTSLVHVLTVIGRGAQEVEATCDELLGRRVERHPAGYGSGNWTDSDHADIERFCVTLTNAARQLPVLYYAQYLDSWSVGWSQFRLLRCADGVRRQICGSDFGVVYYPSRFCADLLAQVQKWRRKRAYRDQAEDRWYLDHVKEALAVGLNMQVPFLVVSVSQGLGGSRYREEILAALDRAFNLTEKPGDG